MGRPAPPRTLPDVVAEDRLLWQFWINKGMRPGPLRARLGEVVVKGPAAEWDYLAGNAMYGGFEEDLLGALAASPDGLPADLPGRLEREVRGSAGRVAPATPEGRLLVLCASPRMTEGEDREATALAGRGIHWEALVQAAARANLTVAVHHNLSRLGLDELMTREPARILAARARGVASRNRRMLELLEELIALLHAEGIRVLLLKESALALSHYGNGRLRMMGDIDLLLGDEDLRATVSLLEGRGWESAETLWTKEYFMGRHHHAAPLVREDLAVKIEPHHGISLAAITTMPVGSGRRLVESMSSRAVRIDARCHSLTPADTLFHLCVDLFGAAFLGKMGQLCDAREVVRQGGVDWPLLCEDARMIGAEAHAAFTLRLLADLDAPVPAGVIRELEGARGPAFDARRLRRMADRNLFGYVRSQARHSRAGEKLIFRALLQPGGLTGRAAFLLKRYFHLGRGDEGVGELARRSRPTTGKAVGRMLTLPWRAVRRWTASRRIP